MKKHFEIFLAVIMVLFMYGCSKEYPIDLPDDTHQLVIEGYLEEGKPYRISISQSENLQDTAFSTSGNIKGTVVIIHNNSRDTLKPGVFIDPIQKRKYNYGSSVRAAADASDYRIEVTTADGRKVTATTRFINKVPFSVTPIFNKEQKAYCLSRFNDNPDTKNFYRLTLNKHHPLDSLSLEALLDDNFANDRDEIIYGSGYNYFKGDTVYATLYHLTPEYHKYLITLQTARQALVNPFAVSGEVISNIKGGLGVFAALTKTQQIVVIPKIQ